MVNKYQNTKTSSILIPSNPQKAALVDTNNLEVVKEACEEISNILDIYEKLLEGKDYIAGEFSLADVFHIPNMQYVFNTGHGDLWSDPKRPNVARWWKNISERESWKNTISENQLFS